MSSSPNDPFRSGLISEFLAAITFADARRKFGRWLDRHFKHDVYELQQTEVVQWLGGYATARVQIGEIRAWQVQYVWSFDIVVIELIDDTILSWCDKYNDLIEILRTALGDRELDPVEA